MSIATMNNWYELNQRYLMAALDNVRAIMEQYTANNSDTCATVDTARIPPLPQHDVAQDDETPDNRLERPALETLSRVFGLSPFEQNVLLMCAGIELDFNFASLFAAAQGDPLRAYPTFGIALAVLPEAHWSALVPDAPLRRWKMLEVEAGAGGLTQSRLSIDERILHYLTGLQHLDERLMGMVEPVHNSAPLVPTHAALAEQIVGVWQQVRDIAVLPVVQLCGDEVAGKRAIAAAACNALGLNLV